MHIVGPQRGSGWRFSLGCLLAVILLFGVAEAYLRLYPPQDLHPYLGERSPLVGIYKPSRAFGVTYQSFDAFAAANTKALKPWLPLDAPADSRPMWAMFGSSFVHMRGMLADTARATVTDHAVFNLGKNEPLPVRMAQIQLLLDAGLKPERIFFQFMPLDFAGLAEHPLDTYHVTARGALTYRPNLPAQPLGSVVKRSRLALTAWCRTGLQKGDPFMSRRRLTVAVDDRLMRDVEHLFGSLARVTRRHGVPVTVILIPNYEHIWEKAPCGFQDALTPMLRELGFDVFDPREAFIRHPNRAALFIPDKHFSAEGNRVLLAELLAHLRQSTVSSSLKGAACDSPGWSPGFASSQSGVEPQRGALEERSRPLRPVGASIGLGSCNPRASPWAFPERPLGAGAANLSLSADVPVGDVLGAWGMGASRTEEAAA